MQDIHNLNTRIQAFWSWFAETEGAIREYFAEEDIVDKAALIEAIDNKVLDFGLFSWQIAPGFSRPFSLTISPNGNKERLKISKMIIQAAPSLPDWEFNYAKPAQDEALAFSLYDDFLVEQAIDASQWRYALVKKTDGRLVVILEAKNVRHLDADTALIAGEQVLTKLLGEELVITHVHRIEVVEELEEEHRAGSAPILGLKNFTF